jgi:hypothetical protein
MSKTPRQFFLFSAAAALTFLAGCPNDPPGNNGVDCVENPIDPQCPADCVAFPQFFPECNNCSAHPESAFCDCANPIIGDQEECCNRDPNDPTCIISDNPNPDFGGIGDVGNPCTAEDFCGGGFDDDCDGIPDDGNDGECTCSSANEETLPCYTGPAGTRDVGECRDGIAACEGVAPDGGETWGSCVGQNLPLPNDDCGADGQPPRDTNCNGIAGDGCSDLVVTCSPEIFAAPLQTRTVTATATPSAGVITSTIWQLTQRPIGSAANPTTPNNLVSNLFMDLAGDYTMTFTAEDSAGASGSCSTILHAIPTENLRIELSWNTPTTDIDSHLLHPTAPSWYHSTLDCMFINCDGGGGPAWGAAGTADDARLDIDDVEGFGPENINIDFPEVNTANGYRFGAYNFTDDSDNTPSNITVRIFCGGIVKAQLTHNGLVGSSTNAAPNELWKVADIFFTSATSCNVVPLNQIVQMGSAGVPR